jgi:hypothetical protein
MSDDKARKIAEEALQRLSAELEACRSETLKNYLGAIGRFHRYSWNNVFMIASQHPGATRVAGFHAWHDMGRWVRKARRRLPSSRPSLQNRRTRLPSPLSRNRTRRVA